MNSAAVEHCRTLVRAQDKDLFLADLFLPEEAQPAAFALHAFACEIARIPHLVSEPQIGEIRLQWWAETLEGLNNGQAQDHPTAAALAEAVKARDLPVKPLSDLVEARRIDLYADGLPGPAAVEGYLGETQSVLFQLAAMIVDRDAGPQAAAASGLAGVVFGLARGLAAGQGKLVPPGETRATMQALARRRLAEFRTSLAEVPRSLWPVYLPVALTELYLKRSEQGPAEVPQWRRQWWLWRAARTERF